MRDFSFGIKYPIDDNQVGKLIGVTKTNADRIASNIALLIATPKGTRAFNREYGFDMQKFLFEKMDDNTLKSIRISIQETIAKYFKSVSINKIDVIVNDDAMFYQFLIELKIADVGFTETRQIQINFANPNG